MKLYFFNLPSSIPNINKWKKYTDNVINIIIFGAGPMGLFTALYLNNKFNNRNIFNNRVNILLIDNRIKTEGIKLPYTRTTQLGVDIVEIQPFISQIFCWTNNDVEARNNGSIKSVHRKFGFINALENLLYLAAFNAKISMYFTDKYKNIDDLRSFTKNNDVHYVFDCTGGRLKTDFKDIKFNKKCKFNKGKYEVRYNDHSKYFELSENGIISTTMFVQFELYDKKMIKLSNGNEFEYITNLHDKMLIDKFANSLLSITDYKKLSTNFSASNLRDWLTYQDLKDKYIKYVKISPYNTFSRHYAFAAKALTTETTYIRLGDSLCSSDLGIIAGFALGIHFCKHVCDLIYFDNKI